LKKKYKITKEEFEKVFYDDTLSLEEIKNKLGMPNTTFFRYKKKFGCTLKNGAWSKEDLIILEVSFGRISLKTLAKKLNRTESAILNKTFKLGITSALNNSEDLSSAELAEIFKMNLRSFYNLIYGKGFPAKKVVVLKKRTFYRFEVSKIYKWIKEHEEFDLTRLDKNALGKEPQWLIDRRKDQYLNKERKNKSWSDSDINYLKANYKNKSKEIMSKELKRTIPAIQRKMVTLNLRNNPKIKWRNIEDEMLIDMKMKNLTDEFVAEELGRTTYSVANRRKILTNKGLLEWSYREYLNG